MWSTPSPLFNGYQGYFLGMKWLGHDFDHYSPPSSKMKNEWRYTNICHKCLHGMGRENVIFLQVSKLVKAVIFLICLGGYLVQTPAKILTMPRFYEVFLSPSKQLQDSTLNLVKAASFHVLSNSLFTVTWHHTVTASLHKLKINNVINVHVFVALNVNIMVFWGVRL